MGRRGRKGSEQDARIPGEKQGVGASRSLDFEFPSLDR